MPATARLNTTIEAIKGGATKLDAATATKNIEGWEEYLSTHDHEGVKSVVADLGKLKKLLQAGTPDDHAIKTLLHKLGKDTTAVAAGDTKTGAAKIKELGEALSHAS